MFQLIVTPQGIEKVTVQLKDTPTKVYGVDAKGERNYHDQTDDLMLW